MYPAPEHILTVSGRGIKSIKDLKGKKVSIDVPGSGCAVMARAILEEYGFNLGKDFTDRQPLAVGVRSGIKRWGGGCGLLQFCLPGSLPV